MDIEILQVALRILNAYQSYIPPAPADVERLREAADVLETRLPADVLATRIIDRELEKSRARRDGTE
jgi:hypothetical protein